MASTRKAILIVEDESDVREGLAWLISHHGYEVETAANGREALAKLDAMAPPCLILLDLMMPEMNGWEFREQLLARNLLANIPVVLVSGTADLERVARTLKATEYIPKPVDFNRLVGIIDAYC